MVVENEKHEIRVGVDFEKTETKFSDSIRVETATDHVIINFIQSMPDAPPDQPNAKIVSRIALSWPHFGRLAQLLPSLLETQRENARNSFESNVYQRTFTNK